MITSPALFSANASAPASGVQAARQSANASQRDETGSFATALAEATGVEETSTQSVADAAATSSQASPTHLLRAGASLVDPTVVAIDGAESDTSSADAVASPNPTAIVTNTSTQPAVQPAAAAALAIGGAPVSADATETLPANGAEAGDADVASQTQAPAGATTQAAPTSATPTSTAATPVVAATPVATAAPAAQPTITPAQTTAPSAAQGETTEAETAETASPPIQSPANGQSPAKASAAGAQPSPAQGASAKPGNAAAAATAIQAVAQADVAAAPSALGQSASGVAGEAVASTTGTSTHASLPTASTSHPAQTAAPAATLQVYSRIVERFDGRAQRFEVRLDPAELGRVDVRIEVGADKKVHAVLAAHDSAALNDLMRGQRALERALADAGIDVADGGVKFELAGDSNRNASSNNGDKASATPDVWRRFNAIDIPLESAAAQASQPWRRTRLDLVA